MSFIMITGYGIIAVPTAIVTSEMTRPRDASSDSDPVCPACGWKLHDPDAVFCKVCGSRLPQGEAIGDS